MNPFLLMAVAYVNWEIADYTIDRIRDDVSDGRPGIRTALAVTLSVCTWATTISLL